MSYISSIYVLLGLYIDFSIDVDIYSAFIPIYETIYVK